MTSNIITIERHILNMQRDFPDATGAFSALLSDIAFATKIISSHVNRAGLVDILGETGERNIQGESVQKLDVFSDDLIVRVATRGGQVCIMASEERAEAIVVPPEFKRGPYVLLFDPLDGSSNIDVNVSIGTIFGIFRRITPDGSDPTLNDVLQPGARQVAAGYVVYGSSTMLVYTVGRGVHGFTFDPSIGEFLLSHEDIRIPADAEIFSVNEGNEPYFDDVARSALRDLKHGNGQGPSMTGRYIGSLVADFHRNLLRGGVFLYPAVDRGDGPQGKLRLLYEAFPLAYIAQQAGGYASDGRGPILDRQPQDLHERTPLFIGSANAVREIERRYREAGA